MMLSFQADHYSHIIDGGYDWHVNGSVDLGANGSYSGDLVRDYAVGFIEGTGRNASRPFFLYVPFQECHSPFQVDSKYSDLYPDLGPEMKNLCGMVTHTDEMIGDIVQALNTTGVLSNSVIIFMGDNGGPHVDKDPPPSRWDAHIIARNYPFRGQKHEIFEGGVHVAGFVYSQLLPAHVLGTVNSNVMHITDWAPTIMSLANAGAMPNTDGFDQWPVMKYTINQNTV